MKQAKLINQAWVSFLVGAGTLLVSPVAQSASMWWDGSAGKSWNNPENWSTAPDGGATPGAVPAQTDDVFFNATTAVRPMATLGAAQFAHGVTFGNNSTGALALADHTLTLGPGGITVKPRAAAPAITSAITLGAPQTWLNNSPGPLTIGSAVANGTHLLTIGGTGDVALTGILGGGSGGLTKNDSGTLTLSGANTFTGVLTVNGGTVKVQGGGLALGTGAARLVLAGGTVDFSQVAASSFGRNTKVTASSTLITERKKAGPGVSYTLGTLELGQQTLSVSGGNVTGGTAGVSFSAVTLSGNPVFDIANPVGGGVVQLSLGPLGGGSAARTVTKRNNGILRLSAAASSLVSGTRFPVTDGVLSVEAAGAVSTAAEAGGTVVTVSGTGELRGTVAKAFKSGGTGAPDVAIVLSGGTLRLAKVTATDFGGALTYKSGVLLLDRVDEGAANTMTLGAMSIGNGTLTPETINYTTAPTVVFSGSTTLRGDPTFDTQYANIVLAGGLALGGDRILTKTGDDNRLVLSGGVTGAGNLILNNNGSAAKGLVLSTAAVNPVGSIMHSGFGFGSTLIRAVIGRNVAAVTQNSATCPLILSGANSFTGMLTVQSGILNVATVNHANANGPLGNSAGPVTLGGGISVGTLEYTGASASSTKPFALAAGGMGVFQVDDPGETLTLKGLISGSGDLLKTGPGRLTLSGDNPFTGALTVQNGTLSVPRVNQADAKGPLGNSAGAVTLGGRDQAGTLEYTGLSAASTKPFAIPADGAGVFQVDAPGQALTLSGGITGGGELIKTGPGKLILSHSATTFGSLTVREGALNLAAGTADSLTANGGSCLISTGACVNSTRIAGGTVAYNSIWPNGNVILTAGTVTFGVGTRVSTANFSVARGQANASKGLAIAGQLFLEDGLGISIAEGGVFTVKGTNICGRDAVRTLTVTGGTVRLFSPGVSSGLDIRAWQNESDPGDIDGARFNFSTAPEPEPTHSTFAGTLGYATEAIAMGNGDQEHWGGGNNGGILEGQPGCPNGYIDHYTVEYRGRLLTGAGTYRFATSSDDGSALWIDPATDNPAYEEAIVQNSGWQAMALRESDPVALTAGYHDILIRFYEGVGENALQVLWDPAGGEDYTPIPGSSFFRGSGTTAVSLSNTTVVISSRSALDFGSDTAHHALGLLNLSGPDTVVGVTNAASLAIRGLTVELAGTGTPAQVEPQNGTLNVSGATLAFTGSDAFPSPFTLVHCTGGGQVTGLFRSPSGAVLADGEIVDINGIACRITYAGEGRVTDVTLSRLDGFMLEIK